MSDDENRIEDLKQSLYSRNAPDVRTRRKLRYRDEKSELPSDWGRPPEEGETYNPDSEYERHSMSFFKKLLLYSAVFCLVAIGVGAYIFFNGSNFISGNNIEIVISGPVSVPGGTPTAFTVTVTNKNSVALQLADLHIRFPEGTTDPTDTTQSLDDIREVIGDIPSGGSVRRTVEAVIFGEENLQRKITATITYGIVGASSVFTKESSYDVLVNASPVVLSVSSLDSVNSGQPFSLTVKIKSNAVNTVKNVIMRGVYPFGFTFKSSSLPSVTSDKSVWSIGDIPPGGERTVTINGVLIGEDTDLRAFHFTVGAKSASNPTIIGTTFMEVEQDVTIEKPLLSLGISFNNDTSGEDYIAQFGRSVNVNVKWVNNLPETLTNVVIVAHLAGSAYDKTSVATWGGYFRSGTNDVVWDQKTNPELSTVIAGDSGTLSFTITPAQASENSRATNPSIIVTSSASGDRPSASNVPLNTGSIARRLKTTSEVSLSGRVVRAGGPFPNSGPIPPVAEMKTTYTIVWSIDNTTNPLSETVVSATLPPYVSWMNNVSPQGEDITYDKNSGTVTWNAGKVGTFTMNGTSRREAAFQIEVEPSIDQVGRAPIIVNQARLSAIDTWTKSSLRSDQGYLTTSYSTDPSFKVGDETVANKR